MPCPYKSNLDPISWNSTSFSHASCCSRLVRGMSTSSGHIRVTGQTVTQSAAANCRYRREKKGRCQRSSGPKQPVSHSCHHRNSPQDLNQHLKHLIEFSYSIAKGSHLWCGTFDLRIISINCILYVLFKCTYSG